MKQWDKVEEFVSEETTVRKFVFTKEDAVVESVLYRYPDYETRTVICCSVQSGCPVGYTFCGTGKYFVRNLTPEEVVAQVDYSVMQTGVDTNKIDKFQIMFMSIGEPIQYASVIVRNDKLAKCRWPLEMLLDGDYYED